MWMDWSFTASGCMEACQRLGCAFVIWERGIAACYLAKHPEPYKRRQGAGGFLYELGCTGDEPTLSSSSVVFDYTTSTPISFTSSIEVIPTPTSISSYTDTIFIPSTTDLILSATTISNILTVSESTITVSFTSSIEASPTIPPDVGFPVCNSPSVNVYTQLTMFRT